MEHTITLTIPGSNAKAIKRLTDFLQENSLSVFKDPIFYGEHTVTFPEGFYNTRTGIIILQLRATANLLQNLIFSLIEFPDIKINA